MNNKSKKAIILGLDTSGLILAYKLLKNTNIVPVILEKENNADKFVFSNYFDESFAGFSNFKSKSEKSEIQDIIDDFLLNENNSKSGANFQYKTTNPIKNSVSILNKEKFSTFFKTTKSSISNLNNLIFKKMPFLKAFDLVFHFIKSFIIQNESNNFEEFLINKFGESFYKDFLKNYFEKFCKIELSKISSDFGIEKFSNSSILKYILNNSNPQRNSQDFFKKIINFILNNGGFILYGAEFLNFETEKDLILSVRYSKNNEAFEIPADYVISTLPLKNLIKAVDVPFNIKQNALNLNYTNTIRLDFYVKYLNQKIDSNICPIIYPMQKDILASKISLIEATSLNNKYDCQNNYIVSLFYQTHDKDRLWMLSEKEIIELATNECIKYNLFCVDDIIKIDTTKMKDTYPIYSGTYKNLDKIKTALNEYKNLFLTGTIGKHKCFNTERSILDGIDIAKVVAK